MPVFLLNIIIGGNFLPLAVHASTTVKLGFFVTSCTDGYATGAFFLNCAVHWDIKCEWYFVHIDDIVVTNFVFGNLSHSRDY